jgi:Nucleotidyl transferase AbiEii toxin, Type IV TA system
MHREILNSSQLQILDFIATYKKKYYLVGGTAIALHIGHRESIDFDLFTDKVIERNKIKKAVADSKFQSSLIIELPDQIHFIMNEVKLTFFQFPYKIPAVSQFENIIKMPDLLTLAAMKAFALGGRGKWKDYVDLYFIIKDHYSIAEIAHRAKELFDQSFNPLLFYKQICFFADINYSDVVNYLPGFETSEDTIKALLIDVAMSQ